MIEQITNRENLNLAHEQVKRNKGAGGVDCMSVKDLLKHLMLHGSDYVAEINAGKYRVSPILGVELERSVNHEHQRWTTRELNTEK